MNCKFPLALARVLLTSALIAGCDDSRHVEGASVDEVNALTAPFSTIELLRVTTWHDQDWCQAIVYNRGEFLSMAEPSTNCEEFHAPIHFDASAEADFARIRQALRDAGTHPVAFHVTYSQDGRIATADFRFTSGIYEYSRSGDWPPTEGSVAPVTDNWRWFSD